MSLSSSCAICGHDGAQIRSVTRSFGHGPKLLVIEGIPLISCPHCGEAYFTAETMHGVERIKSLRAAIAISRSVPVAEFHQPAG